MADVFLSYAREDRARAEQVAQGLQASGLDVFWDSEIPPGTTWADYIEQKLSQCKALIVLWSEHSAKSQWVREEARLGRDKGVLIPAMIDTVQAPFGFGEVQAANLSNWNGSAEDADWRKFVAAVYAAAQREPRAQAPKGAPSRPVAASAKQAESVAPKRPVPVWVWVSGAVVGTILVLAMIGGAMEQPGQAPAMQPAMSDPSANQAAATPAAQPASAAAADVVAAQLQQAQAIFAQQGFEIVGQPFSGGLAQGQTWNVPVTMMPGIEYRILGVCDRDCADLDLVLYDAAGAVVSQDSSTDSQPVVSAAPGYAGSFMLQVQMYNCTVAPCAYALALYGRRIG
jgi:TIR domain